MKEIDDFSNFSMRKIFNQKSVDSLQNRAPIVLRLPVRKAGGSGGENSQ